ncbi:MAG: STAS domain-containing protein [Betaproteobacteria bacterium]|nr:STAS domain-containing protein [Betaproteobacteria bacterium]NDD12070.1 STAS domain-containing protein [Betaproteobacteria bacterium]
MHFKPKLLESLQGYTRQHFVSDLSAGATVGVVALPLAMAFAMASGLKPEAGLFTAIIAGFLISALGGTRLQIGGPAGAFIVIVYGIVERYGVANLIIATALSGVMLFVMGMLKLGTLVRFIPVAVIIGFTNGIAVLIALSQVKDFLGLRLTNMPAQFSGMLQALVQALPTLNWQALGLAAASLALLVFWRQVLGYIVRISRSQRTTKFISALPGSVVVLVLAPMAVHLLGLNVDTIGSRFGGIPSELPQFQWPSFNHDTLALLILPATTLALLGAIESLLCARVADGMSGSTGPDKHDPNQELMAQGIANVVTPFFGGMPATGTIARTVTNIKSGAVSPVAGMVHALALVLIMLLAAPLAQHVPLATLAAILMFVAWNMGEWRQFVQLKQYRMPYRITLMAVFLLTVVVDLTVAVQVGLLAACVTFIYRISSLSRVEPVVAHDHPELSGLETQVVGYRLYGALFFGAVTLMEDISTQLPSRALVLDLKNVIYMDSSGTDALKELAQQCERQQVHVVVCGLQHQPLDIAQRSGLLEHLPAEDFSADLHHGLLRGREIAQSSANPGSTT